MIRCVESDEGRKSNKYVHTYILSDSFHVLLDLNLCRLNEIIS